MIELKIGIIDDDCSKITMIMTQLLCINNYPEGEKKKKYENFTFIPIAIDLKNTLEEMLEEIIEKKVDALLIDYKLSSQKNVSYTGVSLAKEIENTMEGFPIFILTAYEDDLYTQEVFNAYQIVDASDYFNNDNKTLEINMKIIEQILKHKKEFEIWEEELKSLLSRKGESAEIDSKILELNRKLEGSINKKGLLPEKIIKELSSEKIDEFILKINKIIDGELNDE